MKKEKRVSKLVTNKAFVDSFGKFLEGESISELSRKQYVYHAIILAQRIGYYANISDPTLAEICKQFIAEKERMRPVRRATIKHFLHYIKRIEAYSVFMRLTKGMFRQKTRKKKPKTLTYEEMATVYKNVPKDLALILRLEYEAGFRISSILNMQRQNLELDTKDGSTRITIKDKGDYEATGYIHDTTSKLLWQQAASVNAIKDTDRVFPKWSYRMVRYHLKKADLDIHSHNFRHSLAMHMRDQGADTADIKEALHHKAISSTMHYIEGSGQKHKEILKKFVKEVM